MVAVVRWWYDGRSAAGVILNNPVEAALRPLPDERLLHFCIYDMPYWPLCPSALDDNTGPTHGRSCTVTLLWPAATGVPAVAPCVGKPQATAVHGRGARADVDNLQGVLLDEYVCVC